MAIEFVLLFPVFILVMLGALYFAFAFNTQRSLVFVAQSGADAALRVDRSQFDLSGEAGRSAYLTRMRDEACDVMRPLLARQSRTVVGSLEGMDCPGSEGVNSISIEPADDGAPVILIAIEVEPAWRPPLVSQFITTISGSASVPF
ncbi:TadE family protein [Isoalcanivorax indicus]|uniref:TadE family protein n=1 Tax=Isoalcanivorax indicus TaxID=2202653 RepID=UPI0013C3FB80|nr:TadE family protein [Isoalcanivorax indicus]